MTNGYKSLNNNKNKKQCNRHPKTTLADHSALGIKSLERPKLHTLLPLSQICLALNRFQKYAQYNKSCAHNNDPSDIFCICYTVYLATCFEVLFWPHPGPRIRRQVFPPWCRFPGSSWSPRWFVEPRGPHMLYQRSRPSVDILVPLACERPIR